MDSQLMRVIEECTSGSDNGSLSFPEVVAKLMQAGVERYHADLCRAAKTYYLADGTSQVVPGAGLPRGPARDFDAGGVQAALKAIQAQQTDYRQFCERIAAAGCVGYIVSLPGRRAVYYGRSGDLYVEHFPPAP